MSANLSWDFPALISPKFKGGRIHRIVVALDTISVATVQGFYGNHDSSMILTIPCRKIIKAEYFRPLGGNNRCRLTYLDEANNEQALKFAVVNPTGTANHQLTETVTRILEDIRSGKDIQTAPFQFVLTPIRPATKLLYGAILFTGLWLVALQARSNFWLFISSFILWTSGAAITIDHVRIHTAWPPTAKIIVAIFIFGFAFVLFVATIFLLETFRLL